MVKGLSTDSITSSCKRTGHGDQFVESDKYKASGRPDGSDGWQPPGDRGGINTGREVEDFFCQPALTRP